MVLEKNGEDQLGRSCEKNEVFHNVNEEMYFPNTLKTRKANWIGHILRKNLPPKTRLKARNIPHAMHYALCTACQ